MQWLIDTIKDWVNAQAYATMAWVQAQAYATIAWVNAQGFLKTSYIDRGDPADLDFTDLTLTFDEAWHDLDLSAIVPAGAKAIVIHIEIVTSFTNVRFYLRKKGNANFRNVSLLPIVVANELHSADMTVALDGNRIIQYWGTTSTWDFLAGTVKGWWI